MDNLLRLDPASACLPNSLDERTFETNDLDAESNEVEVELSDILLNLRPIKQVLMPLLVLWYTSDSQLMLAM